MRLLLTSKSGKSKMAALTGSMFEITSINTVMANELEGGRIAILVYTWGEHMAFKATAAIAHIEPIVWTNLDVILCSSSIETFFEI